MHIFETKLSGGTYQVAIRLGVTKIEPRCTIRLNGAHVHSFDPTDFLLCPATTVQADDGKGMLREVVVPESWASMLHHVNALGVVSILRIETTVPLVWKEVTRMQ